MMDFAHFWPAFASGFAFFAGSVLTLFLLTLGHKDPITRAFSLTTLATAIWGLFGFLFDTTSINQLELARVWKGASQMFAPAIAGAVTNFAFVYYREVVGSVPFLYRITRNIMVGAALVLGALLFSDILGFSAFAIKEVVVGAKDILTPVPGPFFHGVYAHFFLGALYASFVIHSVLKKNNTPLIRSQVWWMVWSLGIAMVAGGTRFAAWYNFPISPNIAAFAAPAFGIGISYAITKHRLFNTRVIGTEILTVSIWVFLFFLIIFSSTVSERIINSILFLAVVVLGTFLIRGTLREAGQKEELTKANNALTNLNQNLEEIVRERTEELNRAKLHTDAIIENMTLGLVEYRDDLTIVKVNKAAEELLGFSRDEVLNKKIVGSDISKESLSSLAEVLYFDPEQVSGNKQGVAGSRSEISITHPQKRDLQVITFSVPPESESAKNGVQKVKIIRDITREKLIEKNKSDFITIVAHQLRTPLSAIKWVFNMALEKESSLNKDHAQALKDGSQATEKMIHLINDLLNVVSIEEGRFGYEFKQGDIVKTTTDVTEGVRARANWKGVSLETIFPREPIAPFMFDPERISLALLNIVENAVNYTQKGGSVKIVLEQDGGLVKISVKDSGIGIPADDLPKLPTTKFFRSVKALRIETDGSGLGLFIANNIMESHKGSMMIESKEDVGTTVTMALPLSLTTEDTPKTRAEATKLQ